MAAQKKQVEVENAGVEQNALVKGSAPAQQENVGGVNSLAPKAPPSPRRAPGTKEIIPMAWKLVGTSAGTPVTLLKSIERSDVEAQQARLEIEGYYQRLAIYPIADKVPLSSSHIKAQKRVLTDALNEIGEARKAAEEAKRKAALRRAEAKRIKAAPKAKKKAKAAAKTAPKAAKKTAKPKAVKKAAKAKAPKKATVKKTAKKAAKATKKTAKKKAAAKSTKASKVSKKPKVSKPSKGKAVKKKKAARKRK